MSSIVVLDIETTGLNPSVDEIIEIGVLRVNGTRVEDEWETLVNPRRPIPPNITQLTGISNEMIRNAPLIREVLPTLRDFISSDPIMGHNVRFDLSFMQKYNLFTENETIDTYDMAAVLLPTASRYNLGALSQILGIVVPVSHRAIHDCRTTHKVFLHLWKKALELSIDTVAEFVRLSEPFDWGAEWVFKQILRNRIHQPVAAREVKSDLRGPLFTNSSDLLFPPLTPKDECDVLDPDETASVLEYGGPFSKFFSGYEQRPQQVEMLRAVTTALSTGQHLLVEAGTGTGKSFAYLVPAAFWAIQNQRRVVISTNTINLQDQLTKKDIPDLKAALGLDLNTVVLKGRSNYLCPRRLEHFRQRGPDSADEMRVLGKVLVWLGEGGSGDRSEINLNGPIEREIWNRLSADDEGCKAEVCIARYGGTCPFFMAHQAAENAHLIIVNHALLLSDVATGSKILPNYEYLVIDEAHHLEEATTNALSFRLTANDLARMLRELGSVSTGILGHLVTILHEILKPSDYAAFHQAAQRVTDLAYRLDNDTKFFFQAVEAFMFEAREGRDLNVYGQQLRVLESSRTLPSWGEVEISWDTARETYRLLLNLVNQYIKSVTDIEGYIPDELEDSRGNLASLYRRLSEAEENISALVSEPGPNFIYWVEVQGSTGTVSLNIAPLEIGTMMQKYLWNEKASVILTSATLTTNDGFSYLRSRLLAETADELMLGSPFDYESSVLLYVANDVPEPTDTGNYQNAVERSIVNLARVTGGRMLVLFTSYAQLKRTSQNIASALAREDIVVFEQGEGASANTLLENFREAEKAILLGTRSFWEGVDIPGEALSVLVIVKLPFDVPSDPIIAARSETFEDPFNEYSLPEAILRFRQGFGRLIRTATDRGVVAILDRRILSKRYGKSFIEALPACTLKIDSKEKLPEAAVRWLNL